MLSYVQQPGTFAPAITGSSGALPWGGGPSAPPTSAAGLNANYAQEYAKSLAMNRTNYENIMSGYQRSINEQNSGYASLLNSVLSTLQGAEQGRAQAINDESRSLLGRETQSLINRGLGNTTVQQAVVSGSEADRQRRQTELANQFATTRAGYQQQIGQAQLANLGNFQKSQLDFMNSVTAQYPDAGMYASLAQQFAQADAARANQGGGAYGGGMPGPSMPGLPGPKIGYTPAPTPYYGSSGYGAQIGGGGGNSWLMDQYRLAAADSQPSYATEASVGSYGYAPEQAAGQAYMGVVGGVTQPVSDYGASESFWGF